MIVASSPGVDKSETIVQLAEDLTVFVRQAVEEGLSLDGLYPLSPRYRDDYEQWLRKQDAE